MNWSTGLCRTEENSYMGKLLLEGKLLHHTDIIQFYEKKNYL